MYREAYPLLTGRVYRADHLQNRTRLLSILSVVLLSIFLPLASAQERFTDLTGTVKDASGASVPETTVTVINKQTERSITVKTGPDGAFVARHLEPGRYRIEFEANGFQKYVAEEVVLVLGKEFSLSPTLEVGSAATQIQVTESAPLIDTTGVAIGNNISSEQFDYLPKGRSFQSLIVAAPSVNTGQIEGGFQINGASGSENQFFIDGISTNSLIDGRSRQNAAFEFLQEVQVKTGGINAEYGGALGGVVSAITKSGGNAFHGDVHFYYSGNSISAGPVKRLLLLDPYGVGADPSYQQDYKPENNTFEPGGSFQGPILKDKLWFFTSYSPQIIRRSQNYNFSNGLEPDTIKQNQTNQQLFNKLSWDPMSKVRTNFTWLWTPTRVEGIFPNYDGYGNNALTSAQSIQPLKNQGWTQPQSNYNGQIDWTINSTSLLTFRGGRFWDNFRTWGVPSNSSVTYQTSGEDMTDFPSQFRLPNGSFNTRRTQQTNFDLTTRTYYQIDFTKYIGSFFGSHDIKVGGGTQKTVNKVDVRYPGEGYVFIFWDGEFREDRGKYGYYEVDNIGTEGTTGGTISNLYIQDRWRIHPRVTLSLGLRTENEHVPSFRRDIRDDAFSFGFADKLSPRLGVSWDVFGNGKLKAFGSYGRYYDWVKYELSRGTFGGDFWTVYYRAIDDPNLDPFSLSGTNKPGRNLWASGEFRDRRLPSFDAVAPGLKPMSTDLINAGVEYELTPTTVLRANYVRNNLVRTIEDIGVLVNGDEQYLFANPGEGAAKEFAVSTATPPFATPKPQRTYDALELAVNRRFSNRFFGSVSYVYSRLYGNYAGLGNSDEIDTPTTGVASSTSQQSGGSLARPGTSASRAWDLDTYLFDSRGNFVKGRLATDRPHVFKAYGSYLFKWGTDIGLFFYGGSGTPISTIVEDANQIPIFVNGRGDMGRTPFLTQTDLMIGHTFKLGESKNLRFEFNATNVFNQKTSRHIFNQFNRGAGTGDPDSALDMTDVNLFDGYDYRAMLNQIQAGGGNPFDPRYGMNDLFNPGFAGRFMVKFQF